MEITNVGFRQFATDNAGREGIVLLGCGGEPREWVDGVTGILRKAGIIDDSGEAFSSACVLTTTGGRQDIAMVFGGGARIDGGRMALWRIRFGDCSWISDYLVNYRSPHGDD